MFELLDDFGVVEAIDGAKERGRELYLEMLEEELAST
jgi:hypothetical protein